jgi:Polyketide cyclase / dehydrase and lipid transport
MWYMKPVRVSIDVPQAREDVYDFLDVLANHELFTDHMLRDWQCAGPAGGAGAKARVTAVIGGRAEAIDIEVIEAERPARNKERNVGASGRVATGTYTLDELPGGGTRITFESAWERVPRAEALAAPLVRAMVRRGNQRSLERLAGELQAGQPGEVRPAAD